MATRTAIVNSVFKELASAIGEEISAGDLLRSASSLVDLEIPTEEGATGASFRLGGMPFANWSVDAAMASNSGWNVCYYEAEIVEALFEDSWDVVSRELEQEEIFRELVA